MALNLRSIGRSLRHRNYRLFFFGQAVSLIGTWMSTIATSWLVYRLTGSPLLLASLNAVGMLPSLFVSPFAGVQIDRWDKRTTLMATQACSMVQSFALAVLTLSDVITVPLLFALVIFQGIVTSFDIPARHAFLREVVPERADLGNAIALNSALFHGARLIGPAIGGAIIGLTNEGYCFLIDGFSFLAVLIALAFTTPERDAGKAAPDQAIKALLEGLRYARSVAPIRYLIFFIATTSFCVTPYIALLPAIARDIMHGNASTLGFLMASSGMGALVGALYLASRDSILGLGKVIVLAGLSLGGMLLLLGSLPIFRIALPILFTIGFSMVLLMASCNTLLQNLAEPDKVGRVMSFYAMAFTGIAPIGSFLGGLSAENLGIRETIALGGTIILASSLNLARLLPRLKAAALPIFIARGLLPPRNLAPIQPPSKPEA